MIPATLISIFSVLYFAGYSYSQQNSEEEAAKYASFLKGEIEKGFKIDNNDQPYVDKLWGTKKCWGFECGTARQFERYNAQSGQPTAYYKTSIDGRALNPDSADSTITLSKSVALMDSRSEGWVIGGKVSASLGGLGSVDLSATYSKLEVHSRTETTIFGATWRCPARSECRVETWTWHIEIQEGKCNYPRPTIDCGGMHLACGGGLPCGETEFGNSAFAQFCYEKCGSDHPSYQDKWMANRDTVVACPESVKTPLHNADGKAYTVIVAMHRPYSAKSSELDQSLSSESSEWKIIPQE